MDKIIPKYNPKMRFWILIVSSNLSFDFINNGNNIGCVLRIFKKNSHGCPFGNFKGKMKSGLLFVRFSNTKLLPVMLMGTKAVPLYLKNVTSDRLEYWRSKKKIESAVVFTTLNFAHIVH